MKKIRNFEDALKVYKSRMGKNEEKNIEASEELAKQLVKKMTYAEKATMLGGHWAVITDFLKTGRYYNVNPIKGGGCRRLKVPPIMFSDGPRGVVCHHSTCFPTANVRAASFDNELEYNIGKAIAEEATAYGANYFAGICINLLRHPAWGRAQESYGEDQFLLGQMGVQLVKAVQEEGMIACPKHYACNSMENLRFSIDVDSTEETLRDVYLPHFKDCIDAGALSIMGAYNKYRGDYCCENKYLLDDILRKEWGFRGFTTSDFIWGVRDAKKSIMNGMDIEMPLTLQRLGIAKSLRFNKKLNEAAEKSCMYIIASMLRSQPIFRAVPHSKKNILSKPHIALARKAMEEGAVLLKNNGILPLKDKNEKVAVVGRFADKMNIGDHGSSAVYPPYVSTFGGAAKDYYNDVKISSSNNIAKAKAAAKSADTVFVVVGNSFKNEGEFLLNIPGYPLGGDRRSLKLTKGDEDVIKAMKAEGKKVVVIYYTGSAEIIDDWADSADAIIYAGYPGMEGGNALMNLVSGKVNFSGKLPFTIAHNEKDYPTFVYEGKNPSIIYGYYHGYALFDHKGIEPAYPFGFGLSYTTFEYSNLKARKRSTGVDVTVNVTNTGSVAGRAVAEIYVGSNMKDKPLKLLKGYGSVELEPGQTKAVNVFIPEDKLKFYDSHKKTYIKPHLLTIYAGGTSKTEDLISVNV